MGHNLETTQDNRAVNPYDEAISETDPTHSTFQKRNGNGREGETTVER